MKDDTSPAFPCLPPCDAEGNSASGYPYPSEGISTRNYIAIKAMQSLILRPSTKDFGAVECDWIAAKSYQIADLMLKTEAA